MPFLHTWTQVWKISTDYIQNQTIVNEIIIIRVISQTKMSSACICYFAVITLHDKIQSIFILLLANLCQEKNSNEQLLTLQTMWFWCNLKLQ